MTWEAKHQRYDSNWRTKNIQSSTIKQMKQQWHDENAAKNMRRNAERPPNTLLVSTSSIRSQYTISLPSENIRKPYGFLMFSEVREKVHWERLVQQNY